MATALHAYYKRLPKVQFTHLQYSVFALQLKLNTAVAAKLFNTYQARRGWH